MSYFLALDAGGTKTIGAIANDERELARTQTGSIQILRNGDRDARRNLESLFNQLASSQDIGLDSVARTCIGTSGVSTPLVANWIRETVQSLVGGQLFLCGDEEIALDAAFYGGPGVLVVAGTGSNVVGRTRQGQTVHAGGWGPRLADEGSGHWIGYEGLRSAFRAKNEGRQTQLFDAVMEYWNLSGLHELVEKANATPAPDFALLAPVIVACAEKGDAVALEVLTHAGEELAHLALLAIRRSSELDESFVPRVAFTGSILRHIPIVRRAMIEALLRKHPEIEICPEPVDPVEGALWRARNGIGSTAL